MIRKKFQQLFSEWWVHGDLPWREGINNQKKKSKQFNGHNVLNIKNSKPFEYIYKQCKKKLLLHPFYVLAVGVKGPL